MEFHLISANKEYLRFQVKLLFKIQKNKKIMKNENNLQDNIKKNKEMMNILIRWFKKELINNLQVGDIMEEIKEKEIQKLLEQMK